METRDVAALLVLEAEQLATGALTPAAQEAASRRILHLASRLGDGVKRRHPWPGSIALHYTERSRLHPLQAWLYDVERKSGPQSLEDISRELGVSPEQVRSWCRRSQPRRVPYRLAKVLQNAHGFAADDENWPNGIRY